MLLSYKSFEAKFANLVKIIGDSDSFKSSIYVEFYDEELLSGIYLKDFDKHIKIDWNHNEKHDMKLKIKERSQIRSISEFNEIFEKVLIDLFNNHFNDITTEYENYDLHLTESKIHLLSAIDYHKLFTDIASIFVVTLLTHSPKSDKKIDFNY